MIKAQINMIIHNACYLSDLRSGHFIYNGKLYLKSKPLDKDVAHKEDVYVCIDEDGDFHSRGKNITMQHELRGKFDHSQTISVESELGDITRIAVTPVTFEWKL